MTSCIFCPMMRRKDHSYLIPLLYYLSAIVNIYYSIKELLINIVSIWWWWWYTIPVGWKPDKICAAINICIITTQNHTKGQPNGLNSFYSLVLQSVRVFTVQEMWILRQRRSKGHHRARLFSNIREFCFVHVLGHAKKIIPLMTSVLWRMTSMGLWAENFLHTSEAVLFYTRK